MCTSASNHDYIAINKIETNNSFQQCPIIVTDYHYALPRLSCCMLLHLLQYLLVYKTFRYTTNVNSKRILLIIFLHSSDLGAIRFHFRRVRIILLGKAGLANTYPDFFFPWEKKNRGFRTPPPANSQARPISQ